VTGCHLNSAPIHDLHRRLVILRVKSKQALKSYTGLVPSIYTGLVPPIYTGLVPPIYTGLVPPIYTGLVPSIYTGLVPSIYTGLVPSIYTGLVPSIYTGAVLCNMFDDQLFLQPKIVPHCDPTISQRRKLFLFLQRVQHMEPRQERAHSVTHSCKGIVIYGLLILSLCNNVVSCIFYATSKEICR